MLMNPMAGTGVGRMCMHLYCFYIDFMIRIHIYSPIAIFVGVAALYFESVKLRYRDTPWREMNAKPQQTKEQQH